MFKAVIVGCGRIAGALLKTRGGPVRTHGQALAGTPGVVLSGCVDPDLARARRLARLFGSRAFCDLGTCLKAVRPDLVSVCTPDSSHFRVSCSILESCPPPRAIFVEKPVCLEPGQLLRLRVLARRARCLVAVNHSRRFHPRYRLLREMIRRGGLGKIRGAECTYYGGWQHNAVHIVDTLAFLAGDRLRVEQVCRSAPSRHTDDPNLDAVLRFRRSRAPAHLHAFDEACYQIFDLDLRFSRARVRVEDFERRWVLERRTRLQGENVLAPWAMHWPVPEMTPLEHAYAALARHLSGGAATVLRDCSLETATETMATLWDGMRAYEARSDR